MMMVSEVGDTGAWTRAFEARHMNKFTAPTVEGIDFPSLGVYQAWNDTDSGILHVGTYVPIPDRRGRETSWRVTGLSNPADVSILCDGEPFTRFDVVARDMIRLNTVIDNRQYQVFTNYRGSARAASEETTSERRAVASVPVAQPPKQDLGAVHRAGRILLAGGGPTCPCCTA
jgi:hypothetical protein